MDDAKTITDLVHIGAAAWASKEVAGKLLGPTFDYLGGELRAFTQKCNLNLTDIFLRAQRKLGDRLEEPGTVSPRVLKNVIDEGAFCDDEVAAEYIAGVLAASRVDGAHDDRGVSYLAVVRELSAPQLRMHYFIYWSIKRLLDSRELSVTMYDDVRQMQLFLPAALLDKMFGSDNLTGSGELFVVHALTGLGRHNLIEAAWWGGNADVFRSSEPKIREDGYLVKPAKFGVELFLWANGHANVHVADFLNANVNIDTFPGSDMSELPVHFPDRSAERAQQQRETEAFVQRTIAGRRRGL
jgi:hypothetical protein